MVQKLAWHRRWGEYTTGNREEYKGDGGVVAGELVKWGIAASDKITCREPVPWYAASNCHSNPKAPEPGSTMEIATTFRVKHAPDKVYAFLTDMDYQTKWVPNLISIAPAKPGAAFAEGAVYFMTIKEGRKNTEYEVHVMAAEPGKRVKLKMNSWGCGTSVRPGTKPKMVMYADYQLSGHSGSTDIRMIYGCDSSDWGFFKRLITKPMMLFAKIFMGMFRKAIIKHLDTYQPKRA